MSDTGKKNGCPTEMELSAYLDGALTEDGAEKVRLHLEGCERCRTLAAELSSFRPFEEATLPFPSTDDCPGDEAWGEYLEGNASRSVRRRMDAHIAACPRCRTELVRFRLRKEGEAEFQAGKEIVGLVKGLVSGTETGRRRPASSRVARPAASLVPWFVAGAGAAAVFLLAFLVFGRGHAPPEERGGVPKNAPAAGESVEEPGKNPHAPSPGEREEDRPAPPTRVKAPPPSGADPSEPSTPAPVPEEVETPPRPSPPEPAPAPPDEDPDPVETAAPDEEKPAPEPDASEAPEDEHRTVTRSEVWDRATFQPVAIQGEEFGERGAGQVRVTGGYLPLPREGELGVAVKVLKKGLVVDANGDGKPETLIRRDRIVRIQVRYAGGVTGWYLAEFSQLEEGWCYRSRNCMAGRVAGVTAFLFDENGNGRFNDKGVDTLAIDYDSNFSFVSNISLLGENLYNVRISEAGTTVETKPYTGPMGYLDMRSDFCGGDAGVLTAVFSNGEASINATALSWPVPAPVGRYRLHRGWIRASRNSMIPFEGSEEAVLEVRADAIAHPSWGGPLTIEFDYTRDAKGIRLDPGDIRFIGLLGERYFSPRAALARTRVTVRDAESCRILLEQTASIPVAGGSRTPLGSGSG